MVRAFPRTWRACILDELSGGGEGREPDLLNGMFTLVAEALDFDEIVVSLTGTPIVVRVESGVPEGGTLGPLTGQGKRHGGQRAQGLRPRRFFKNKEKIKLAFWLFLAVVFSFTHFNIRLFDTFQSRLCVQMLL